MIARAPVIGLVGGIGAGKSAVAAAWRQAGCEVSDSDRLAREAFDDPTIARAIRERWGGTILDETGGLDRRAIGRLVFADEAQRRWLESIVHPFIEQARRAAFAAAPASTKAFVIDAPLLLEAGLDRICDAIVFVDAPHDDRLARVARSRGWDAAELARREAAQWPLDRKRAKAHHVLRNAGDLPALHAEARRLLDRILAGRSDGATGSPAGTTIPDGNSSCPSAPANRRKPSC